VRLKEGQVIEFETEDGRVFKGPITRAKLHSCDAGNGVVYVKVFFQGQEPTEIGEAGEAE
jgi:hypothetical protein